MSDVVLDSPSFSEELLRVKSCRGRVVGTAAQLETLRFCNVIEGSLTITVTDVEADFDALRGITAISGALLDLLD